MVNRELTAVLNLDPKKDLPKITLENKVGVGDMPAEAVVALKTAFGQSDLGSKGMLQLIEQARNNGQQEQYTQYWMMCRSLDFHGKFELLLAQLAGFAYGLKEKDIKRSKNGEKRDKIVIDAELSQPDAEFAQEDWVGPHRYSEGGSFLCQLSNIAEEEGINCQVVVHAVAEYLGKKLVRGDRSLELFTLREKYQPLDLENETLEVGDVLFFHQAKATLQLASLHMAVFVGFDLAGVPWVIQAVSQPNKLDPAAEVVPLSAILTSKNRFFYGAVRIK